MASTVLGKRTRRANDTHNITNTLPARKRRARCSEPQVYEDAENLSNGLDKALSTPHEHDDTVPNNSVLYDSFQDENIPPAATTTPTTNRVKDVLGLQTPNTPKRRVRLGGSVLTPRTPRTLGQKSNVRNVFGTARQLFTQSNNPTRLVGRDAERTRLRNLIADAVAGRRGGCAYVSGPPGTGKSALVHEVFRDFEEHEDVEISTINCISLRAASEVYGKLLHDFAPQATVSTNNIKQYLSKIFLGKSKSKSRLLLLDEIDNLIDTDCDILYTIFEWAMHRSSTVILVGIANALDLTDRFLPRLRARGLKPDLLPFLPYSAAQTSTIITDKLRSLLPQATTVDEKFVPFMQPPAIQLCGKKIASQTGDLRKAFSLVRRVLDQLEKETNKNVSSGSPAKQPLGENTNTQLRSPAASPFKSDGTSIGSSHTVETAPRASIAHVARVASSIFNNGTLSRLSGLNLQQKAVLCSLVSGEKRKIDRDPYTTPSKSTNRIPTVKDLFTKYTILCRRDEGLLHPLKDTEFRDVVASLETLGLVHEQKGRNTSILTPTGSGGRAGRSNDDKQIVSAVSEQEMRDSLDGAGADLLRRLLDEA